ncbi:chaperone protein dnaJ 11, chloroplastic-like [Actinidia eriantha]|uniref:chaperone protein dnaJ 11, chloroplastic-like n=1 Tax=Actinidia eriantha TaxID=165200 RepID=UPI00258C23FE|nr:chaperone protein dnaJ 11, chloroplastic-like [Actinidia eriantha]
MRPHKLNHGLNLKLKPQPHSVIYKQSISIHSQSPYTHHNDCLFSPDHALHFLFLSPFLRSLSPHIRISGERSAPPSSVSLRTPRPAAAACATAEISKSASCASSLYEILGIPMGASGEEIKAAYRKLARISHPDVASAGNRRGSSPADEFMRIHAAYSTLSDPEKRADYDRKLFRRYRPIGAYSGLSASPLTAAMSRFSGYTCRNWETDQCW